MSKGTNTNLSTESKGKRKKPIKNAIKNVLDSPFVLKWPSIDEKDTLEIKGLLTTSFSGLKKANVKPPWIKVQKLSGECRKKFIEDYKKCETEKTLEKDPSLLVKQKQVNEAWSHFVVGFNAVMRGLEKGNIAGVIVKKNVTPELLIKIFLPLCENNSVPLIPIEGLDLLLKDDSLLGISYSCIVLGLKKSATQKENSRFYPLHVKMCEILQMASNDIVEEGVVEENETYVEEKMPETKNYSKSNITDERDVKYQAYCLKRKSKTERAFVPGAAATTTDSISVAEEFISFGNVDLNVQTTSNVKPDNLKPKINNIETINVSSLHSDDLFELDTALGVREKESNMENPKEKPVNKKKKGQKRKNIEYASANMKRIKKNKNRKSGQKNPSAEV